MSLAKDMYNSHYRLYMYMFYLSNAAVVYSIKKKNNTTKKI